MNINSNILLLLSEVLLAANALYITNRIIGGKKIFIDQAPHHGLLIVNNQFYGTVVLVDLRLLLTSAQNVDRVVRMDPSAVQAHVLLGSSNLISGQLYPIIRISHHSNFSRISRYIFPDNIAVIHLRFAVEESSNIKPARLPPSNLEVPGGVEIFVTGFSSVNTLTASGTSLVRIKILTETLSTCQSFFRNTEIKNTNFCSLPPRTFGCNQGDSGSGVFTYKYKMLIGLVSDDTTNCGNGRPEIFTNIAKYNDYIESEKQYFVTHPLYRSNHPSINLV